MNNIKVTDLILNNIKSGDIYLFNHFTHKIKVEFNEETSDNKVNFRASIRWDFGDGTVIEGLSATHYYSQPGKYIISATRYGLDGTVHEESTTRTVYVKDVIPTEISFINPDNWKKEICISKNNKLGAIGVSLSSDIISNPGILVHRRWGAGESEKDETHYNDCKSIPGYHLKKYYTFLEEDEKYAIDKENSNTILRPTEKYSCQYFNVYGKLKNNSNEIEIDACVYTNGKKINTSWFKPYKLSAINGAAASDSSDRDENFNLKTYDNISDIPNDYFLLGRIGLSNIWYRTDYYAEGKIDDLIFEIEKEKIFTRNFQDIITSASNIPPLGISVSIKKPNDEEIYYAITSSGMWRR